ncbi:MAG: hypothetical protein DBX66_03700 [Clostridiales bacterium]|uniref:YbbR domain-containing protein n=1 Tax=Harryflintia acetispora TaxID=1849041 RepID=A0A9X8Y806_9FIRM|nr:MULTISPECIES: CdaR family protein [Oscillospiraceae]PWM38527.1 MAG: hypothetical protein DBX66_03700 [Clostridiales bacterium]RGB64693.1 hypothetical protein DW086_11945 [Harryflintia acetispora]TCL42920.1 YbbR domain-containing protein [Harryflintia acetispora]
MKKIGAFFKRCFDSNRFLKVFSLVVAFIIWLIVATTVDPYIRHEIVDIPVNVDAQSAALQRQGLSVITIDPDTVRVTVHGKRYVVGRLTADDIKIVPKLTSATSAGTQTLRLEWSPDGSEEYTVESITPAAIVARFDRIDSKTLDIQADVTGVSVPDGYIKESEIITPDKITIRGPTNDLQKVAHAIVSVDLDQSLTSTANAAGEIVLKDSDGNVIENEHITMDYETAEVTIPVLKKKEVPLRIDFLNVPQGFPIEELHYTLSNDSITIAGPQTLVDSYQEILLGRVDLKTLDLGSKEQFDVTLPSGFENVDNILSVEVTFDTDDYVAQNFNLSEITLVNEPQNYDVTINNPYLNNVKIVGPSEVVSELTAGDIVAEVDVSDREVVTGQIKVPVQVYVPNKGTVWAVGNYSTLVTISEKQ